MNQGFSHPIDFLASYLGNISGLRLKASNDGRSNSIAEATDDIGDSVAFVSYGSVTNPTLEYAVIGSVDLSAISLGKIIDFGSGTSAVKYMLVQVEIRTAAGTAPTISFSAVQVESSATEKRTYALFGTLTPRFRAQDLAGAFIVPDANNNYTEITTTFSVDPHIATVAGVPRVSDASHGVVNVQGTITSVNNQGHPTATTGWTMRSVPLRNNPDSDYMTKTATATKALTGVEASASLSVGNRGGTSDGTTAGGTSDGTTAGEGETR